MMIKEFKDSLTVLKTILEKIEKIEIILEIEQIKKITKKELKELGTEKFDELGKVTWKTKVWNTEKHILERPSSIVEKIELREITRK